MRRPGLSIISSCRILPDGENPKMPFLESFEKLIKYKQFFDFNDFVQIEDIALVFCSERVRRGFISFKKSWTSFMTSSEERVCLGAVITSGPMLLISSGPSSGSQLHKNGRIINESRIESCLVFTICLCYCCDRKLNNYSHYSKPRVGEWQKMFEISWKYLYLQSPSREWFRSSAG